MLNSRPTTSDKRPKPVIREISKTGLVWIEWEQDIFFNNNLKYQIEAGAITFVIDSNYDEVSENRVLVDFEVTEIDLSNIYI